MKEDPDVGMMIKKYWSSIIVGLLYVTGAAILMVFLMRWIATPLLWTFIVALHIMLFASKSNGFYKQGERVRGWLVCIFFLVFLDDSRNNLRKVCKIVWKLCKTHGKYAKLMESMQELWKLWKIFGNYAKRMEMCKISVRMHNLTAYLSRIILHNIA